MGSGASSHINIPRKLVDPSGKGNINSDFFALKIPRIDSGSRTKLFDIATTETYSSDPFNIAEQLCNRETPVKFLFVGITGDLFTRFFGNAVETLVEALPEIRDKFEIIPVARTEQSKGDEIVRQLREKFPNSPIGDYLTISDCENQLETGALCVDGTYLSTPPDNHLSGTSLFLEKTTAPVFCEKPLCLPRDLASFSELLEDAANRIVPVDCFTTTIPLYWLMNSEPGAEILARFGEAAIFNGTVAEDQPVEINRFGGNLGLLRESVAGGGIALDCGIHSYAMARATLGSLGINLGNTQKIHTASTYLTDEYLNKHLDPDYRSLDLFRDTAGVVQMISDTAIINAQGMKGTDRTVYALDIISKAGERIVISLGTDKKFPYLAYAKNDGSVDLKIFSEGFRPDVGYTGTLYSLLSFICHQDGQRIFPQLPTMIDATHGGVEVFSNMNQIPPQEFEKYLLGTMPLSSIATPDEIDQLVPEK